MKQVRINCIFTEEAVKQLDKLKAVLQVESVKPLSRPDAIRIALEEMIRAKLK